MTSRQTKTKPNHQNIRHRAGLGNFEVLGNLIHCLIDHTSGATPDSEDKAQDTVLGREIGRMA